MRPWAGEGAQYPSPSSGLTEVLRRVPAPKCCWRHVQVWSCWAALPGHHCLPCCTIGDGQSHRDGGRAVAEARGWSGARDGPAGSRRVRRGGLEVCGEARGERTKAALSGSARPPAEQERGQEKQGLEQGAHRVPGRGTFCSAGSWRGDRLARGCTSAGDPDGGQRGVPRSAAPRGCINRMG